MKNILVLSFFPAFVPPESGGEVRLFNFYLALSKHFNIKIISSGHVNAKTEHIQHARKFKEVRVAKGQEFLNSWQMLASHAGNGDLSAPSVLASCCHFSELNKEYFESYDWADLIVHESPFTVDLDIYAGIDKKPRIYNSYNCESDLYKTLHGSNPSGFIPNLVRSAELRMLAIADLVTYCSDADLIGFENLLGGEVENRILIPNGMSERSEKIDRSDRGLRRAIFIGSAHLPNVAAAKFIAEEIAPLVPDLIFDIVGTCLPVGKYPSNIRRHGLVDEQEKERLINDADIAINPMLSGGGSSLKILEFAAHGLPILSTRIGVRGFDFVSGVDCLVHEIHDFQKILQSLIEDPSPLESIGRRGAENAVSNYTWTGIARTFSERLTSDFTTSNVSSKIVLAINDFNPFDAVGGGATRLRGIYGTISKAHPVVLMCFTESPALNVSRPSSDIWCISVPKTLAHRQEEVRLNDLFHISANDIVAFRHAGQNEHLIRVYAGLRKYAAVVLCEHPYMVELPVRYQDQFIYSSQNHEKSLKHSLMTWHPERDSLLKDVERAENMAVQASVAVVAVSFEDAHAFTIGEKSGPPILVIANGADIPEEPSSEDVRLAESRIRRGSVVFLGSAHMPNVEAAKFIVEKLALALPGIDFHLLGSVCSAIGKDIPKNLHLWGIVSNSLKAAVLERADLAINPMFSGSGSNVKLADFMANGLHVVSTEFGSRGYPAEALAHVSIADEVSFVTTIQSRLRTRELSEPSAREMRRMVFRAHLSMQGLARAFIPLIDNVKTKKKRVLFVTYRYCWPVRGGAEGMMLELIRRLGESGNYKVDVVSTDTTAIHEFNRFGATFSHESTAVPVGMENVRFAKFPCDIYTFPAERYDELRSAWHAQVLLEHEIYSARSGSFGNSGLGWGWGPPEGGADSVGRWAMNDCSIHLADSGRVRVKGFTPVEIALLVTGENDTRISHAKICEYFEIEFECSAGSVTFSSSLSSESHGADPRPLGFYVSEISINENSIDLSAPRVHEVFEGSQDELYMQLHEASRTSRGLVNSRLTEIRGPFSIKLEKFLEKYARHYDLIITHNSVFRPAVAAIEAARKSRVPSILVPHAHLDDDFYHFPDIVECALNATSVMASPRAACDFFRDLGAKNVEYLPAGVDVSERGSEADIAAFRQLFKEERFFLILGRKARAKGYRAIIEASRKSGRKEDLRVLIIGPDDDGERITESNVTYLGAQPRSIVLGALRECCALVNMSTSESFGIVLLEAWLNGRPVIANKNCAAFRDMAVDEVNSLLVAADDLGHAMARLFEDESLCTQLAAAGFAVVSDYDWQNVSSRFLGHCDKLVGLAH